MGLVRGISGRRGVERLRRPLTRRASAARAMSFASDTSSSHHHSSDFSAPPLKHAHSPEVAASKAVIDSYFAHDGKWTDPWTPCLNDHPPSPDDLSTAVDWSLNGDRIIDACNELMMPQERFEEAMEVRSKLEDALREEMNEKNLKLFTFGSCMSGLGTKTSDLDLVIMRCDDNGRSLDPTTREEQIRHFEDYQMILRRQGVSDLKLINARVPILRREGPEGVNFDISLFFHGVRNSLLLREYARSCPFFMPMSIVLREYCRHIGVNDSFSGFLTPYCLNIMIIKYLVQEVSPSYQVPIPPLLPPSYYPPAPSQYLPPPREMQRREKKFVSELGKHTAGFLRFYACYSWMDKVISAADPIEDSRAESVLWADNNSDVIIEEMFSQQDKSLPIPNMGHKVDAMRLLTIREKLIYAYLHTVQHDFLPADPEDKNSPPWTPRMPKKATLGFA